jgi:hypothetical protein
MVAASRVPLVRLVFLSQALLAAGCDGAAPGTVGEFYDRAFAALCRWAVACQSVPDVATCRATLVTDLELTTVQADVDSGRVRYDAAQAGPCLAYYDRVFGNGCRLSAFINTGSTEGEVCNDVLTGTVADGSACFINAECVSRVCELVDPLCLRSQQCCPGTCAAQIDPTPVGGDCSVTGSCVPGSYCTTPIGGTTRACAVPSNVRGTPCTSSLHCASPLYCDFDLTTTPLMGTCEPLGMTGQPCNPDLFSCDDGRDYCDQVTATCTRRGGVGSACDPAQSNCLGLATCVGTTCVADGAEGGACAPTDGPGCLGSLECSTQTNTCAFPATAVGPCI